MDPMLVTGNKPHHDPAHQTIYDGCPSMSRFYDLSFLDLPNTSMVFRSYLFKDITLCHGVSHFVIYLVCRVTFQKLRLYEYSGNTALF